MSDWPGEGTLAQQMRCPHKRTSTGLAYTLKDTRWERFCLDCGKTLEHRVIEGQRGTQ